MEIEDKVKELVNEWDKDGLKELCKSLLSKNKVTPEEL